MRLFVGVEIDDAMRAAADASMARLRSRLKRKPIEIDARWIPAENLHVTIWFLGEVSDARAGEIEASLAPAFSVAPFVLGVAGAGAFPPSGPPRVLWFAVTDGVEPLRRLHDELRGRFGRLGIEPERATYSPHLTVARIRRLPRGSVRELRDVLAGTDADCGACRVAAVTLFRSRTAPTGATYEALLRVPLS